MANTQTRPHRDIDIIAPIYMGNELEHLLEKDDFVVDVNETKMPHRLVMLNCSSLLMIDVHLVEFQPDGSAVWTTPSYDAGSPECTYTYSAQGFGGIGKVDGTPIPCLTLEEQINCRTTRQYSFDDPDRQRANGVNADLHDLQVIENILRA